MRVYDFQTVGDPERTKVVVEFENEVEWGMLKVVFESAARADLIHEDSIRGLRPLYRKLCRLAGTKVLEDWL